MAAIIQQPTAFGPKPIQVTCPSCHESTTTRVEAEASNKTHILAVLLCVCGCLGCIPYCCDSCKSKLHYCEKCGNYLGAYNN